MQRTRVSLLVLGATLVAALLLAPNVLLMIFAGALLAVFLRAGGGWIAAKTGIPGAAGVGAFIVVIIAVLTAFGFLVAPRVVSEIQTLIDRVPAAIDEVRGWVESLPFGDRLIAKIGPGMLSGRGELATGAATGAVSSVFGVAGNTVIILFVGLYGALDPTPYRKALLALLAPSLRPRGAEVIDECVDTLRRWVFAKLLTMAIVGVLTGIGLWFVGIPLPFALGTIAGLLAFIPNLGPVLALLPGLLLGLAEGGNAVWWVLGVYLGVQTLESYAITPLLQQYSVELPPAFILATQVLFATLFGLIGLALATPVAALGLTLTRTLYVRDTLEASSGS